MFRPKSSLRPSHRKVQNVSCVLEFPKCGRERFISGTMFPNTMSVCAKQFLVTVFLLGRRESGFAIPISKRGIVWAACSRPARFLAVLFVQCAMSRRYRPSPGVINDHHFGKALANMTGMSRNFREVKFEGALRHSEYSKRIARIRSEPLYGMHREKLMKTIRCSYWAHPRCDCASLVYIPITGFPSINTLYQGARARLTPNPASDPHSVK
jgi:hypothetical protein